MYQVMIRKQHGATWETYAAPTGDPFVAMRHLQQAKGTHAEVTVVQATTASELALLVDRIKHRDCAETWSTGAAMEQPPAKPSHEALLDERHRWAMEQGPGGDHDEPYHFELPASARVTRAWIQLMARRIREEQDAEPAA